MSRPGEGMSPELLESLGEWGKMIAALVNGDDPGAVARSMLMHHEQNSERISADYSPPDPPLDGKERASSLVAIMAVCDVLLGEDPKMPSEESLPLAYAAAVGIAASALTRIEGLSGYPAATELDAIRRVLMSS